MPPSGTKPFRTIDARPDSASIVKPGELIDVIEMTPLTLTDRRVFNMLIENAWDAIDRAVVHSIPKTALRGTHESNDRVGESVERLYDRREAVLLEFQGERVGYLNRQDFCSSGPEVRLSEAQGSALAGISAYKFITLKCPVEGCNAQLPLIVRFDEAAPPYCPKHRNPLLQVERWASAT